MSTPKEWIQVYERIETREELRQAIARLQREYDEGFGAKPYQGETSTEGEKAPDKEDAVSRGCVIPD